MGLFDGGIQKIVGKALGKVFLPGVLYTDPTQEKIRGVPSGDPSWKSNPFRGLKEDYEQAYASRSGIPDTDVKILALQAGLRKTPKVGDEVLFQKVRYTIIGPVKQDPASATWEFQARPK